MNPEEAAPQEKPAPKKPAQKRPAPKKTARKKTGRGSAPRPIPVNTVEECIGIVKAIKEKNGLNPWEPKSLADEIRMGVKGTRFYYLTGSSRDYGLTVGTSRTPEIALTDLAKEYLFAEGPAKEREAIQKAFFNIEVFRKIFDYYKGEPLPEMKYLARVLEGRFEIQEAFHEDTYRLYKANLDYINSICDVLPEGGSGGPNGKSEDRFSITIAKPKSGTEIVAFVAMPFSEKTGKYSAGFYSEVLNSLITPAAVEAGFTVETARKDGSDIIHSTIINQLLEADLVIADLSDHNPNVLFELGVRMAHDRPVALIRAEGTGQIFDVDNLLRVYDYNPNLWKSTIDRDLPRLTKHFKGTWDNRESTRTYMKILTGK